MLKPSRGMRARLASASMASRSSTLGLSMPSTVPDCSSMSFWPGCDDQRRMERLFMGASPQ